MKPLLRRAIPVVMTALAALTIAPVAAFADDTPADDTATAATTCVAPGDVTPAMLSHTFDPTTGAGTITYNGTEPLCEPFVVRATTWRFQDGESPWPQDLVGFNDTTFTQPGTYSYTPPGRDCGQLDIYAGWSSNIDDQGGDGLAVPDVITGPGSPYEPRFLHEYSTGPNPTYDVDAIDCMSDDVEDDGTEDDGTEDDATDDDGTEDDATDDDATDEECVDGTTGADGTECESVLPGAPIDQDGDTPEGDAVPVDTEDPAPEPEPTVTEDEVLDTTLDATLDAQLPRTGVSVPGAAAAAGLAIGLGTWLLRRRSVTPAGVRGIDTTTTD
ncbi:MAG TPA: LPXTG cell wall anchor domain-containing protein [Egicoccus sp.]|nr:LPXTG cell wall anchor domain-containing protein [Egicoccus sp.]HSK22034.1 LPXTG cell wall anchor domain-containing protein [Egicoccus sp.]